LNVCAAQVFHSSDGTELKETDATRRARFLSSLLFLWLKMLEEDLPFLFVFEATQTALELGRKDGRERTARTEKSGTREGFGRWCLLRRVR